MSDDHAITLTLDRRLFAHPRAYHLRRMRAGLWLYLALMALRPADAESFEVEPAAIGLEMGLPEGTVRSWLGHLRKAGYLDAERLNGKVSVRLRTLEAPTHLPETPRSGRFFTVDKLLSTLGERDADEALQAALNLHSDEQIKRALAGALAVPREQIRRSRTALFLYLLGHNTHE